MAFARSNLDGGGKPLTYWQQRRAIEREARQAERRGGALGAPVAKVPGGAIDAPTSGTR